MSRFRSYTQQDSPPVAVGDSGFKGINSRLEPHLLPEGYASDAINMRFNHGVAETRKGSTYQAWANKLVGGSITPWSIIYGVGVYTDPATRLQYLMIAADGQVWYAYPNNVPVQMTLPTGVQITKPCTFTQAFDVLLLHQDDDTPTLVLSRITQPWTTVLQTTNLDGTSPIPNAKRSIFFQNRVFIPHGKDQVAVSDYGDYTRFLAGLQEFSINQGSPDKLVNIYKYNDSTLICFKEHSIYAVTNVEGNLANAVLDEVTSRFGLVAPLSIAQIGNDLWFLSELGVMSLKQTELNKVQGVSLPQSDPIQPLIDRINWRYAANASAVYWNNRYYLAVPLDDAEVVGENIVPHYQFSTIIISNLVIGDMYRWSQGNATSLQVDGVTTLTASGDFVATDSFVTLSTPMGTVITSTIKHVRKGVNTAILVYDFLNEAWSGYDTITGADFKFLQRYNMGGEARMLTMSSDGWVRLYEESFDDENPVPYVDLIADRQPATGDTLQINSGTLITADQIQSFNNITNPTEWGTANPVPATPYYVLNLFTDIRGIGGYYANAIQGWLALNCNVLPIDGGIRLVSTNSITPVVSVTGTWANVQYHNTQPIQSSFTTRGYTNQGLDLEDFYWLSTDLQTWGPEFSIDMLTEGANEVFNVASGITKDITKFYRPFDKADYALGNTNGDFATAYRQDYSLALDKVAQRPPPPTPQGRALGEGSAALGEGELVLGEPT